METKIATCATIISHSVTDLESILEALNLSGQGVLHRRQLMRLPTNTRLAVYGDSVATRYLCGLWVRTSLTKGQWTQIRSSILSNENLARVGFQTGLDRCLNLNPGTAVISQAMMATTVEAILGAVHLDGGDQALASVMIKLGLTSDLLVTFTILPFVRSVL
ncbi:hypothetical protein ZTR_03712 [Talaromyces verruculosus]|nr:hypothetical protein ZTR_03712 [Talaromyces verruculosus]